MVGPTLVPRRNLIKKGRMWDLQFFCKVPFSKMGYSCMMGSISPQIWTFEIFQLTQVKIFSVTISFNPLATCELAKYYSHLIWLDYIIHIIVSYTSATLSYYCLLPKLKNFRIILICMSSELGTRCLHIYRFCCARTGNTVKYLLSWRQTSRNGFFMFLLPFIHIYMQKYCVSTITYVYTTHTLPQLDNFRNPTGKLCALYGNIFTVTLMYCVCLYYMWMCAK